jgi:hypothetical protein
LLKHIEDHIAVIKGLEERNRGFQARITTLEDAVQREEKEAIAAFRNHMEIDCELSLKIVELRHKNRRLSEESARAFKCGSGMYGQNIVFRHEQGELAKKLLHSQRMLLAVQAEATAARAATVAAQVETVVARVEAAAYKAEAVKARTAYARTDANADAVYDRQHAELWNAGRSVD